MADMLQPYVVNCKGGLVLNKSQFEKIQSLIQSGIDEGATLVAGGAGRPSNLEKGY